jgi:phage/plasmid-associated DNA primase
MIFAGIETDDLWRQLVAWNSLDELDLERSVDVLPTADLDCARLINNLWGGRLRCLRDRRDSWMVWGDANCGFVPDTGGVVMGQVLGWFADAYWAALDTIRRRYDTAAKAAAHDELSRGGTKASSEAASATVMETFNTKFKKHAQFRDRLRMDNGQTALERRLKSVCNTAWTLFDVGTRWLAFRNGVVDLYDLRMRAQTHGGSGPGGMLTLRDVVLLEHEPFRLLTQVAVVDWNPAATHELWDWALERSLPAHGVRLFYQRLLGGSLLGTPEKRLVNLLGPTNSGKSTTLNMMRDVWGSYVFAANVELFLKDDKSDSFELDKLRKARMVTATEPEMNATWDEALLKKLTGGDTLSTRSLFVSEEASGGAWTPRFTMFVGSNHVLKFHTSDRAMADRLCPLLFPVSFRKTELEGDDAEIPSGEKAMPELDVRLQKEEAEGIAVWSVRGMLDWLNGNGAGVEPVEVTRGRSDVAEAVDTARAWVRELVEGGILLVTPAARAAVRSQPWVTGSGGSGVHILTRAELLPVNEAHTTYATWCREEQGMPDRYIKTMRGFRETLADLYGIPEKSTGVMKFPGLGFVVGRWRPVPRESSWTGI